ncbi:MAG TPA: 1,4-beta-xylanase [Bacteroides graminisolvens]|uniref:1,4-beta-xylanase n=1 Tax=Bacteroides graminisolvens TaxID=477666 RepID=A0A3D2SCH8_9BACE|nr:1,4-beta-xylanase [Bacteroides graminisolvens]
MKIILVTALLIMTTSLCAQKPIELPLWPNGAPNSNELKGDEQEMDNGRVSNIKNPDITVYRAENPNGMAVIMCPGGGYARLAMNHEGHDMAPWFNTQGITYVVLKYRMPNGHKEVPFSDVEQAIRLVRQHAAEWNINPAKVGIMGASAGGHLASTLATHYTSKETRPDFQILLYPVITMDANFTHAGSRENLITKNPSADLIAKYSNELQVNAQTPQAFIALSSDDKAVLPQNSINYYLALLKHNVPATMHIYPTGGHGWGFRDNFTYKRQWTDELEKWLRNGVKL